MLDQQGDQPGVWLLRALGCPRIDSSRSDGLGVIFVARIALRGFYGLWRKGGLLEGWGLPHDLGQGDLQSPDLRLGQP